MNCSDAVVIYNLDWDTMIDAAVHDAFLKKFENNFPEGHIKMENGHRRGYR